jgi:hypothetical protein
MPEDAGAVIAPQKRISVFHEGAAQQSEVRKKGI